MMPLPVVPPPPETAMPNDFLCDPEVDSKRYAVDHRDSAFNVTTSQYPSKHSYGYRGGSCSVPVGFCRQALSPGIFKEGNRNGESVFYAQTPSVPKNTNAHVALYKTDLARCQRQQSN